MKLRLAVFRELHRKVTDKPQLPLQEGIRGDKYRCHIFLRTGGGERKLEVSADSPTGLRREVDRMVARLLGEVVETSFSPPKDVEARQFLSLREDSRESEQRKRDGIPLLHADGSKVPRRYDSSGKIMVAEPLALNTNEIGEFSDGRTN